MSQFEIRKWVRKRVRVTFDGANWIVNLPHYQTVPGTWEPVTEELIHEDGVFPGADMDKVLALLPTVEVDVPDRLVDETTGELSKEKVRALYRGIPKWDHEKVLEDL